MGIQYEPVIGLEVHAQVLSKSKMFCGCSTSFGAPPNTQTCPVCLGLPGSLPVPNKKAIELALRAALAVGCTVRQESRFARKNYFYPDLAKGYQISQFELPLNERGYLDIETANGKKRVGILRIHVEEDAAKNLHGVGTGTDTLVDFNRAGVALIEIVGDPDLRNADEAEAYLKKLREILMFVGANDGNLEEGSFRCDANVSIRPVGQEKFGTRCELKNINSFRFVKQAIDYEIARHESVLSSGGKITQETRTWSQGQQKTISMRSKEEAHDYRYFPDPDLPALTISDEMLAAAVASMPELPEAKRARWQEAYKLTAYDTQVLTGHPAIAEYFEETVKQSSDPKRIANFVASEVLRYVTTDGLRATFPVTAPQLAELFAMVDSGVINGKIAKDVFIEMAESGKNAKRIVEQKGLAQVTDTSKIEEEARKILDANPKEVERYRGGKESVMGFFVGQLMKAMRGTANPATANETFKKLLS